MAKNTPEGKPSIIHNRIVRFHQQIFSQRAKNHHIEGLIYINETKTAFFLVKSIGGLSDIVCMISWLWSRVTLFNCFIVFSMF